MRHQDSDDITKLNILLSPLKAVAKSTRYSRIWWNQIADILQAISIVSKTIT